MKIRWAHFQYFAVIMFGLLFVATSANAGSFKDFILDEGLYSTAQRSVQIPANSQSASCMQCHDGSNGKNIGVKHADTAMTFSSHGSSNHPVGMSYDTYVRKSPASYVAPARLDSRIKLENGQVTCVSCHETKSHKAEIVALNEQKNVVESCASTKTLTTGSSRTQLCMSCHAM